jgi:uncharacterized membrane-anchored protein
MKKSSLLFISVNLFLFIGYLIYSVIQKERILSQGKLVLLELAPVDPRSLMQGDYMALNYKIGEVANDAFSHLPVRGYCVLRVDSSGIATRVRLQKKHTPLSDGEYLIPYTKGRFDDIHIGAESFFFKEGTSAKYDSARYGGLRIDAKGNCVLVGLYDPKRMQIR